MFIDSHCHVHLIDLKDFEGSQDLVMQRSREEGVHRFLNVAVSTDDFTTLTELAAQHDDVEISIGLHPNADHPLTLDEDYLRECAKHAKVVAIGETGLDFYRQTVSKEEQLKRFATQINVANEFNKPLIIHTRDAREETIAVLKENNAERVGGVMHCFTESLEMAKQALELNFYISFSGIITFKNALELQEVVKNVPLERILIETDCPYLAPVPFRGKQNYPGMVRYTAEKVAELKNISLEQVAEQTAENYLQCFRLT